MGVVGALLALGIRAFFWVLAWHMFGHDWHWFLHGLAAWIVGDFLAAIAGQLLGLMFGTTILVGAGIFGALGSLFGRKE